MTAPNAPDQAGEVPRVAAYALAEAFTCQWWDQWSSLPVSKDDAMGIRRSQHREVIELPKAERLIRLLWTLPKLDREAIASAICRPRSPTTTSPARGEQEMRDV